MQCCLWFRSVLRAQGPWPKRYGYHLSIITKKLVTFTIILSHMLVVIVIQLYIMLLYPLQLFHTIECHIFRNLLFQTFPTNRPQTLKITLCGCSELNRWGKWIPWSVKNWFHRIQKIPLHENGIPRNLVPYGIDISVYD